MKEDTMLCIIKYGNEFVIHFLLCTILILRGQKSACPSDFNITSTITLKVLFAMLVDVISV